MRDLLFSSTNMAAMTSRENHLYATMRLRNKRPPPKYNNTRDDRKHKAENFRKDIESAPFQVALVVESQMMSYGHGKLCLTEFVTNTSHRQKLRSEVNRLLG